MGETSGSTHKMHLSFREDETRVKMQIVDLFHHKPDVYIRQLQVPMCISAIQLPSALFGEPPLDSGVVDNGDRPESTFAVKIKCHSKTLDRLKERK